ncbi:LysR family transcriptional regulator [Noviherbaspirillum aridicola]|uniref:LysR family transcriptional regulator n=1 Tax=Noviherbaspirillum aridicola TaxID=2849687 RepID=A0ABQ4Q2F6_9BURK|nr:LysR family transcriptional regulator [Noviherbaspirillum aridicola]GIZ51330.1 LysR family transcriptional regulator [Noviherbaspirillum aridicola]
MEHLAQMMTFAKVVETRSFSAAALALATSKSLVSKQVSSLESALGVKLLNRTTRSMSLTEAGAAYYEHCQRIAHEIEAASQTVTQLQAEPRGVLRLTSPVIFASLHLAPALESFCRKYEKVEVELHASDRPVDLVDERYDLAIRITSSPPQNLVARPIAPVRWVTCASPEYLAQHGIPQTPQDLEKHQCLVYQGEPVQGSWRYLANGREVAPRLHSRFRVNNTGVLMHLALNGMGVVMNPTYVLGDHLRSGRLQPLLTEYDCNPGMSLQMLYLPNRYMQPKVRAFIDHLLAEFGPVPPWDRF